MNLQSPIFDRVRIPPRRTPAEIGMALCAELGVDHAELKASARRKSERIKHVRLEIVLRMRAAGIAVSDAANWLGYRNKAEVHSWLTDAGRLDG